MQVSVQTNSDQKALHQIERIFKSKENPKKRLRTNVEQANELGVFNATQDALCILVERNGYRL